ncbi:hypothetical protein ACSMDK_09195 [Yersinia enterocolitica]|uniref:hypothetical protein n=1 Tax=Yersinia TaxID=629 RepID=UPI003AB651B7
MNKNAVSEFKSVATEFEKNNFTLEKNDSESDKTLNPHRSHEEITQEENDIKIGLAFTKAVREQKNNTLEEIKLNEFRKAYINGHGLAGIDVLGSGSSAYSAKKLVDLLIDNDILSEIKDIRLTGSYSADRRPIKNLTKEEIDKANQESGFFRKNIVWAASIFYGESS